MKGISDVYYRRGIAKLELGQYKSSIADFEKAGEISDDQSSYRSITGNHNKNLGITKFHQGEYQEAINNFDEAVDKLENDKPKLYYYRGLARYKLGKHLCAIIDLDIALRLALNSDFVETIKEVRRFVVGQLSEEEEQQLWHKETVLELHGHLCVCGSEATELHYKNRRRAPQRTGASRDKKPLSDFTALCKECDRYLNGKTNGGFNQFSKIDSIPEGEVYEKYLASDSWKTKREMVLERDKLCICAQKATAVHHKTYERLWIDLTAEGNKPFFIGSELLSDLVAVCENCHEEIHGKKKNIPISSA